MFRSIAENAFDMVGLVYEDGTYAYCNPSFKKYLGYEPGLLIGQPALNLVHPDDKEFITGVILNALSEKKEGLTNTIRWLDIQGQIHWVEHRFSFFRDAENGEQMMLIMASDVTEIRETLEKERISAENFRNFIEAMEDMLVIGNHKGEVLYVNPSTVKKLGYTFEEIQELGILGLHPADKQEEADIIFEAMFRRERDVCPLPLQKKDKTLLPVETRVWFGKWDHQDCIFGLIKDLSAEQEALQRFNKMFECNPALMAVSTIDTRVFIDVNQSFLDTLGYTREDVIGKTSRELGIIMEPEKFQLIEDSFRKNGSARNINLKVKSKNGKILTGLFYAELIENHGKTLFLTVMVDITGLIEVKDALSRNDQKLNAILKAIPDLLFIFDKEGNFLDVFTDKEERLLIPAKQFLGHNLREFFPADTSDEASDAFTKSLENNELVTFRYVLRMNDTDQYYEARVVPADKESVICMVREVTGEINALRTIRESEQKHRSLQELFRNMADNMPDMLWAKDLEKRFIFTNKAICDKLLHATGITEPIGKTDMFFADRERNIHPDDPEWHTFGEICRDSDSIVMETQESAQFEEFGNVRGNFLFLDVVKTPLRDESGKMIGTVGAARDVTARVLMEKQNLEQQKQIRLLGKAVEQSPVTIVITNRKGIIEYVNPKFTEVTGYPAGEAIGQNPSILKSGLMDDAFYKNLWSQLNDGKPWYGEFRNRKKNGELFWEFCSISPIFDDTGDITHFIAIKEDITNQKSLIEDYLDARKKAEESDNLKTAFLQNMSHELRTPLNGIMGFSALLASGEFAPDEVGNYAGIINKNSNRLLNLINNIVDLSKIDAGTAEKDANQVSPVARINDVVNKFSGEAEKSALTLKTVIPGKYESLTFITDAGKLDQILTHLVSNAIKFTREGSVEIGFNIESDFIVFFVKDTGIGISSENFDHIFDRFYQVNTSMSRGHEGAGLGLSLCKGFVELQGGKIWVESNPGIGSVFYFTLPLGIKLVPENIQMQKLTSTAEERLPAKILIAEDEVSIFQFLSIILGKRNYQILHAVDGSEAITLFKNNPNINLILMDIKMPIMDGYKATQVIRDLDPAIPIIAITAYAMAGDREKALGAGCTDYLAKPLRREDLLKKIDQYL